jgi:histidyl-tRNA synthetase
MTQLRAVKGMNDVLPDQIGRWHRIERTFARTMSLHGFREVRTPFLEPTPLFVRTVGETTDIVEKEMYTFEHHGESLTLRPEGTAGAARAYVEHNVHAAEPMTRWWYAGPMFRAERPQRGRYRQFYQLGAEVFGDEGPGCEAEVIDLLLRFLQDLSIPGVRVIINSLGGEATRLRYRQALVEHLTPLLDSLSPDSQRRLRTNPLRILDSKDERDQTAALGAPTIDAFLDDGDRAHFESLRKYLDALGTTYTVEKRLVRGLDYYTRTVFEFYPAETGGSQDALAAGGRYDGLAEAEGWPPTPGVGFASGLERVTELVKAGGEEVIAAPAAEVVVLADAGLEVAAADVARICRAVRSVAADYEPRSLRSKMRSADKRGARWVVLLSAAEVERRRAQLKDMASGEQVEVAWEELAERLA